MEEAGYCHLNPCRSRSQTKREHVAAYDSLIPRLKPPCFLAGSGTVASSLGGTSKPVKSTEPSPGKWSGHFVANWLWAHPAGRGIFPSSVRVRGRAQRSCAPSPRERTSASPPVVGRDLLMGAGLAGFIPHWGQGGRGELWERDRGWAGATSDWRRHNASPLHITHPPPRVCASPDNLKSRPPPGACPSWLEPTSAAGSGRCPPHRGLGSTACAVFSRMARHVA
jgi:hypothetical protein